MNQSLRSIIVSQLKIRYGFICWYCGAGLSHRARFHIDHIKAKSRKGTDTLDNMALSCVSCNFAKGKKSMKDFFSWVERIRKLPEFPATDAFDEDYLSTQKDALQIETIQLPPDTIITPSASTVEHHEL